MKFTWGHGIIVFFAIFLTWIIGFVIFTLGENNDLVTKDYYRQGAEYTKHMAVDKRSKAFKDSISIDNIDENVSIHFSQWLAKNTTNQEVYFYRPSGKKDDVRIKNSENKPTMLISKNTLKKGRYKVSFSWTIGEKAFKVVKDFTVK